MMTTTSSKPTSAEPAASFDSDLSLDFLRVVEQAAIGKAREQAACAETATL